MDKLPNKPERGAVPSPPEQGSWEHLKSELDRLTREAGAFSFTVPPRFTTRRFQRCVGRRPQ